MIESSPLISLINLATGYALEGLLSLVACLALVLKRPILSAILILVAISAYTVKMYGFHQSKNHLQPGSLHTLSIFSMSVRSSNPNLDKLLREIMKSEHDIIALQEVQDKKILKKYATENTNYHFYYQNNKSTVIISKFPAVEHKNINNLQKVILEVEENKTITIYNLHAPKFIKSSKYYNDFFTTLTNEVNFTSKQPTIIAGDFNSTKDNYWRKRLEKKQNFKSALHDAGSGWLATFPSKHRIYGFLFPFLSIDDIYVKNIGLITAKVIHEHHGSDHYPVYALLESPRISEKTQ